MNPMRVTCYDGGRRPVRYMAIWLAGLCALGLYMAAASAADLSDWFSDKASDRPLPPEEAFVLSVEASGNREVLVRWDIVDGYYLYRDKTSAESGSGDELAAPLPAPTAVLQDPNFGRVAVFRQRVEWIVPRPRDEDTMRVRYQGCKDDSVCYPPQTAVLHLSPSGAVSLASVSDLFASRPAPAAVLPTPLPAAAERGAEDASWSVIAVVAYLIGLGLAFTPCVLPLLPIVSGLVIGAGSVQPQRIRAVWLSMAYVLSMSAVYGLVGVLSAALNFNAQAAVQKPLFVILFSVLLFAFGLAMLGVFQLQWASSMRQRLDRWARSVPGGTIQGAFALGALSAIMVGPCTAPPVLAGLAWANVAGSPVSGGLALFAMGLGLGTPLLLVGMSAGFLLPRPGPWMNAVKSVMGFGLITLSLWNAQYLLPEILAVSLWSVLLICAAVLVGALEPMPPQGGLFARFKKITGLVFLAYGIALAIPVARQAEHLPWPLIHQNGTASSTALNFTDVHDVSELERQLRRAADLGQPVMLNVRADWCVVCRQMERDTFTSSRLHTAASDVLLLRADVTDYDERSRRLLAVYNLYGPPAVLFFSAEGVERKNFRVYEFMDADLFISHMQKALIL